VDNDKPTTTRTFQHLSNNRIEKLDNNRTVIHVGEQSSSVDADSRSVSDIINRFNTLNHNISSAIWDGQYSFNNEIPATLLYHLRLPAEASMDSIRIQPDSQSNLLKVYTEPANSAERISTTHDSNSHRVMIRSIPRICRLPRDHHYDYSRLRVIFLRDHFIRIEVPTLI
jgi:hypothetical protein